MVFTFVIARRYRQTWARVFVVCVCVRLPVRRRRRSHRDAPHAAACRRRSFLVERRPLPNGILAYEPRTFNQITTVHDCIIVYIYTYYNNVYTRIIVMCNVQAQHLRPTSRCTDIRIIIIFCPSTDFLPYGSHSKSTCSLRLRFINCVYHCWRIKSVQYDCGITQ